MSFLESLLGPDLVPLAMVILIDIAMSGDNAIIIGLAAAGLPAEQRRKAIFYGVMAAAVIRIVFAVTVVYLLAIIGLCWPADCCCCGCAGTCGRICAAIPLKSRKTKPPPRASRRRP